MADKSNFEFLKEHDPVFFQLAFAAEQSFSADPNTTLIKLRQLGEAFAQDMAARCGIEFEEETSQADLLFKLSREIRFDPNIRDLFHTLRIEGNRAAHQFRTKHKAQRSIGWPAFGQDIGDLVSSSVRWTGSRI